ncbi:MAG: FkbM family methyltransferase [Dehalococcoidia bacterium]|nr:FkbM family methyltransferase [Dehalococcoidia bacterium]MDD5493132.1 FkbM family methyltransferase [Dehalococcoidia bacterium]
MKTQGSFPFRIFKSAVKPFIGTGIGRFRPIGAFYNYLAGNITVPEEESTICVNGYRMHTHSDKKGIEGIAHELLLTGTYEEYTSFVFKQYVKKGMTVLDIGANIGYFTLLAASLVGEGGKVYAFEPEPKNYNLLVKNVELNSYNNIVAVPKAVSDRVDELQLFIDRVESGGHSLFKESARRGNINSVESVTVSTTSIDEFFGDNQSIIDVIKIDIEGAEVLALKGMQNTLSRNRDVKLFTEFTPHKLRNAGNSAEEYWAYLVKSGFNHIYIINSHKKVLENATLDAILRYCRGGMFKQAGHVNLLCAKISLD